MPPVFVNGDLLDERDAVISVFDHGLVTGDGVFESVLVHEHRPFALRPHLERLERSASVLGLELPERTEIEEAVRLVVEKSGLERAKLRLTVTAGLASLGSLRGKGKPSLIVAIAALDEPPPEAANVLVAPWPRNERSLLAGAKTTSYAENVAALSWAFEHGGEEALFLNLAGNLCEGTGTNVFVSIGDRLVTPPLSAGCLAGVTRGLVLEATEAYEEDVSFSRLGDVTEAFLTSTTRGAQPIRRLDGRDLPECPGPLTAKVQEAFRALLEEGVD